MSLKNLLDYIKYQDEIITAYSQKVLIKPYLSIDGEAKIDRRREVRK